MRHHNTGGSLADLRRKQIRKLILSIFGCILSVGLLGALIIGGLIYQRSVTATDKMHHQSAATTTASINKNKPISILLLGTDTGDLGRTYKGRTDSIMVATVIPKTRQVRLTSIPRDLISKTPADAVETMGAYTKINSQYTFGGIDGTVSYIQNLLNIPINYYALINMKGIKELTNAVGGIDVNVGWSWTDSDAGSQYHFKKGVQHLNGDQVLAYTRMRHHDPRGDYGRQERQRQVLTLILKKVAATHSYSQYSRILKILGDNVQTNVTSTQLISLAKTYYPETKTITHDQLQGDGAMIDESAYQVVSDRELYRVSKKLRQDLGLTPVKTTLNNYNIELNKLNPDFDFGKGGLDNTQTYHTGYEQ